MKVEGILISKTPYKERDIIGHILTRRGYKLGVYIYGGQGGGKSKKGSLLELGHMLRFVLQKKQNQELQIAKVDEMVWSAKKIRENYSAFILSQFFLEVIGKLALDEDFDDQNSDQEALFSVLSNALYHLDEACSNGSFDKYTHLQLFMVKLTLALGVMPDTESCSFCQKTFKLEDLSLLDFQNGGFNCLDCTSKMDEYLSENRVLSEEYQRGREQRRLMSSFARTPYKEFQALDKVNRGNVVVSFNYLNYQFGFTEVDYKTWKLLFE